MPKEYKVTINGNSIAKACCTTNAAACQRITLSWLGNTIKFTGQGENNTNMTWDDKGTTAYVFPVEPADFDVFITFEYENSGGGWSDSTVYGPNETPKPGTVLKKGDPRSIDFNTEDLMIDDDKNDSLLTIQINVGVVAPSSTT